VKSIDRAKIKRDIVSGFWNLDIVSWDNCFKEVYYLHLKSDDTFTVYYRLIPTHLTPDIGYVLELSREKGIWELYRSAQNQNRIFVRLLPYNSELKQKFLSLFDMISLEMNGKWCLWGYRYIESRFDYYKEIFTKFDNEDNSKIRLDFRQE